MFESVDPLCLTSRERGRDFGAMPDAELPEDVREMPFDRAVGEEERRGDLPVRLAFGDERGDALLGGRQRAGRRRATADPLELGACALGPERGADPLEDGERFLERRPRLAPPLRAALRRARARGASGLGRAEARPSRATRAPPRTPRARRRGRPTCAASRPRQRAQLAIADARSSRRAFPSYQSSSSTASSAARARSAPRSWSGTKRTAPARRCAPPARRRRRLELNHRLVRRSRARARGGRAPPMRRVVRICPCRASRARARAMRRIFGSTQLRLDKALEREAERGRRAAAPTVRQPRTLRARDRVPARGRRARARPRRAGRGARARALSSPRSSARRIRSPSVDACACRRVDPSPVLGTSEMSGWSRSATVAAFSWSANARSAVAAAVGLPSIVFGRSRDRRRVSGECVVADLRQQARARVRCVRGLRRIARTPRRCRRRRPSWATASSLAIVPPRRRPGRTARGPRPVLHRGGCVQAPKRLRRGGPAATARSGHAALPRPVASRRPRSAGRRPRHPPHCFVL